MKDFAITMAIIFGVGITLILLGQGIKWVNQQQIEKRQICAEETGNPMYCYERYR